MRAVSAVTAAAAVALVFSSGRAQAAAFPLRLPLFADDPAAAQALFAEAKRLMGAGKYADACPKLEESERLGQATGTKFNLADCYEHVGRTASAWAGFLSVAAASKNSNQPAREKAARDRARALEPKLSRIAIVVPDGSNVNGLEVKRDDQAVGAAEWGEALPVDPGQHTIVATAPGKRAWKGIVEVAAEGGAAKVIVPPLDDEPPPVVTPAAPPPASASPPPPVVPPPVETSSARQTAGFVLLGTGVVAAIGGGVFWAMRSTAVSNLEAECHLNGNQCPSSAQSEIANGKTYDALSITLFAVGGAALLGGAGLLLLGGGHHAAASAQILPLASPRGGGVGVVGSF